MWWILASAVAIGGMVGQARSGLLLVLGAFVTFALAALFAMMNAQSAWAVLVVAVGDVVAYQLAFAVSAWVAMAHAYAVMPIAAAENHGEIISN